MIRDFGRDCSNIALLYGLLKVYNTHNRHQSEQAANNAVRLQQITSNT